MWRPRAFSSRKSPCWVRLFQWAPSPWFSYHHLDVWCHIICDAVFYLASICLSRRMQASSCVVYTTAGRCLRYLNSYAYTTQSTPKFSTLFIWECNLAPRHKVHTHSEKWATAMPHCPKSHYSQWEYSQQSLENHIHTLKLTPTLDLL